jgi:hypothetical protein
VGAQPQPPVTAPPAAAPSAGQDDSLTAKDWAGYLAAEAAEGVKDGFLNMLFTLLLYAGILLAWILPVAGVVIGVVGIVAAMYTVRSKFLPIVVLVFSIIAWIVGRSPLGMLPLILEVL